MHRYRIDYIDGYDHKFKTLDLNANSPEAALIALKATDNTNFDHQFDHQIVEIVRLKTPSLAQ